MSNENKKMTKKADKSKYPEILAKISTGVSVRKACEEYGVPESTFRFNVDQTHYARAREACVEALADEIMDISDDGRNDWMEKHGEENPGWLLNGEHVQRSKLRVDTRKWLLSKIAPKKYGDKVAMEHSSPDGSMTPAPPLDISHLSADELMKLTKAAFSKEQD